MKITEILKLHRGDEVTWTDPNNPDLPQLIQILEISVKWDVIHITGLNGERIECFAGELS